MSGSIRVFTTFPKEMFRVNNGTSIRLRGYPGPLRPARSFDLLTIAGKVLPKALDPKTYAAPNGASMRPNTPRQQELVQNFSGTSICIYVVPAGTQLPSNLILVHEHADHYAIQPNQEMTVDA
ncbi:uncharacterized protein DSM5745_07970 [Aspergillus mulundensis]|uniref:Tse2 ADP-ribosyltransferase toxin domain-containing protein n=1 Tax=Aspergillus mulundensis TaxID=1810919 RepID=A0A3D8R8S6_9EURO|nr:Uncharacterized protein DSM5745_07970 [Aspergillus mulundensis]RDW70459.1 Uncharacterized protein DSM5745_07970 [Aspergillus mulundensis]